LDYRYSESYRHRTNEEHVLSSFVPVSPLFSHFLLPERMNRYPQKLRFQMRQKKGNMPSWWWIHSFCRPDTTSSVGWPGATKKAFRCWSSINQTEKCVVPSFERFGLCEKFYERTLIPYIDINLNPHQSCNENFGFRWHDFLRISASSVCVAHGIAYWHLFFGCALFLSVSTIVTLFV
jgi:hypothetical protein